MVARPRNRARRPLVGAALVVLWLALLVPSAVAGFGRVAGNPADRLTHRPIDPYRYDYARGCRRAAQSGTIALQGWLERNARGIPWGILRCSRLGSRNWSLHAEGRALDWHLNVHRREDFREADRLIRLLLAPDRAGNAHALARRMGVQEIIWNCRAWWSGSAALAPYSACYGRDGRRRRVDDTTAHRDHIHFGLNWPGARRQSSFWARAR